MPSYSTGDIRNIVMAGHMGTGKTTLADAMLFASGAVPRQGSVNDGTSFCDFEKEEKEHGHSIFSSVVRFSHGGRQVNIVDTPGSPDLLGQAISCLPAGETIVTTVSAQNGVELITRRMMDLAASRHLARMIVVTKINAPDVDIKSVLEQIQATFGRQCLPINLPAEGGSAVVDCLASQEGESALGPVEDYHANVIEQIVEMDEALMETYLEGEELDPAAVHDTLIRSLNEGHLVPVCFTDAKTGVGVQELLDIVTRHLPSPLEGPRQELLLGDGEAVEPFEYEADSSKPLVAHVFKVATDPFVGKLSVFRVHQGTVTGNMTVLAGDARKGIKLNRVFNLLGKDHAEADAIVAGDIGAVAKVEDLHIGDILHDDHAFDELHIKPLPFPTPMYGLAVAPKARGDEGKISSTLARLQEEDPTFKVGHDPQTRELVINGLGELHLRFMLERLKNRGLEVETRPPKIAYRETIQAPADGHYRHKKQTGGAGQFGEVFLKVEPLERGQGYEFVDAIFGGAIPGQFMPAVEKGVKEMLETGYVGGYPIQDIKVTITDGKSHPVDSKEVAFKTAGKYALRDAISKARPVVLEPIVNMEVVVPEDAMGAITGDLSSRRGRVQGTDMLPGGLVVVKAQAPLAEVTQYQSMLKSVTGGQGSFMMEFSHYEPVPPQVQQQIAAAYKPQGEEE